MAAGVATSVSLEAARGVYSPSCISDRDPRRQLGVIEVALRRRLARLGDLGIEAAMTTLDEVSPETAALGTNDGAESRRSDSGGS